MVALDALVMSTALTAIGAEFAASIEALEWTISGYLLPFAVFLIAASGLGDRFGRRRIFVCGLMLFTAALGRLRPCPGDRLADRGPRRAGHRGRDGDAAGPDPAERGLPAGAPGLGARRL